MKKIGIIALLLLSSSAFALRSQSDLKDFYFKTLKDQKLELSNHGYLCENLAILHFERIFPKDQYQVFNGIVYRSRSGVIGELDIAIMKKDTKKFVLLSEVKCRSGVSSALHKAKSQLKRFLNHYRVRGIKFYIPGQNPQEFGASQFIKDIKTTSTSFLGTKKQGFTFELDLQFSHIKDLLNRLRCYKAKKSYDSFSRKKYQCN